MMSFFKRPKILTSSYTFLFMYYNKIKLGVLFYVGKVFYFILCIYILTDIKLFIKVYHRTGINAVTSKNVIQATHLEFSSPFKHWTTVRGAHSALLKSAIVTFKITVLIHFIPSLLMSICH